MSRVVGNVAFSILGVAKLKSVSKPAAVSNDTNVALFTAVVVPVDGVSCVS